MLSLLNKDLSLREECVDKDDDTDVCEFMINVSNIERNNSFFLHV
jgi:hypothetical protein